MNSFLNPEQQDAVTSTEGPLLIFAGAGSGKTRVICHRIAHLIEKGAAPGEIIAVTFTNKAADEMKQRVEKLIGLPAGAGTQGAGPSRFPVRNMWVSTFHSAAVRMLRADYPAIGGARDFSIYDDGDTENLLKRILKDMGLDPKVERPRVYAAYISRAKDELLSPDRWIETTRISRAVAERAHALYSEYQIRLRQANALDFGDLLVEAVRLLSSPDVLSKYHDRFRYILVDEYQDTNTAQSRMIHLLASRHRNLCVVGDDDQSIYEWRGADRRNILAFETTYPEAKVIMLNRNYRSTQPILDAASELIGRNHRTREKKLVTDRKDGVAPEAVNVSTEYEEIERVIADIKSNVRNGGRLADHAIFFRVHAQSRVIEDVLSAAAMPYQLLSGVSFYQRAEIKDVMAYLKLIANPRDTLSLRRTINNPVRGIGETTIARIALAFPDISLFEALRHADDVDGVKDGARAKIRSFVSMIESLKTSAAELGVAELLRETLDQTKYLDQYDEHDPDELERIENVRELLSVAQEHQASSTREPGSSCDPSLEAFLERTALSTDVDKMDRDADSVLLLTLHAAKGLEFKHVFIVGCEESLFPHSRATNDVNPAALEEERRLAYVGCTRAMDTLKLYYANERRIYGRMISNVPSRFIREAGLETVGRSRSIFGAAHSGSARNRNVRAHGTPTIERAYTGTLTKPGSTNTNHGMQARTLGPHSGGAAAGKAIQCGTCGIFSEGDSVNHHRFGRGTVLYVSDSGDDNEVIRIKFPQGVKDLMSRYANLEKL